MQVSVSKEFTTIFVPDNSWARFSFGNTKEYYLVSENIFIVKMRGLCYLCTLRIIKDSISGNVLITGHFTFLPAYHSAVLLLPQSSV